MKTPWSAYISASIMEKEFVEVIFDKLPRVLVEDRFMQLDGVLVRAAYEAQPSNRARTGTGEFKPLLK